MDFPKDKMTPLSRLPEDALIEILSCLPAKYVCRFKSVSKCWHDLISDPVPCKKLPQTLAGFFYVDGIWSGKADNIHDSDNDSDYRSDGIVYTCKNRFPCSCRYFIDISGRSAPFINSSLYFQSFMPELPGYHNIAVLDCCNGLLLWGYRGMWDSVYNHGYFVCNPVTKQRLAVPASPWALLSVSDQEMAFTRLIFDPSISSHFHLVNVMEGDNRLVIELHLYPSKTGVWSCRASEWSEEMCIRDVYYRCSSVYFNCMLHVASYSTYSELDCKIISVDAEGKTWRTIPAPKTAKLSGTVCQSQGHLHYLNWFEKDRSKVSVWVLEDYDTGNWILKHSVSTLQMFGVSRLHLRDECYPITVHPDCNLVFFVNGRQRVQVLMSYHIDSKELCVVSVLKHGCELPVQYVPFFSVICTQ